MSFLDRSIPRVARYTFLRQWPADVCAGAVEGLIGLAAFAAMRSLGAEKWIAPLFVSFGQLLWLLAPMWEAAFARFHFRAAFLWMGAVANAPLLLVAFVDPSAADARLGLGIFAAAVMVQAAVDAAYVPHRGALLRANVPEAVRGRLFGMLSTISKFGAIVSAKAGGLLLDRDPQWLRVVFPAAGLLGFTEHWILSRIHWHKDGRPVMRNWTGARSAWAAAADAWRTAGRILSKDRAFLEYEAGFMLYGAGFMMTAPMVVVFAEHDLALSYGGWTWAQGFAMPAAQIATTLACGRVVDRFGVVRTTATAFALLSAVFVSFMFVHSGGHLAAAYAAMGVAMAVVNLGWSLGPLEFAPPRQARSYVTVHALCVGVRSAFGPFLGLWIAERTGGPLSVFACSAACVMLGAVVLAGLPRRTRARLGAGA